MRRRYLISYDVSDDKRRTQVFKTLSSNGDHVQFSVFVCELNDRELATVKGLLSGTVHHDEDQVLVLDLGRAEQDLAGMLQCIGRAYEPRSRVLVV